MRNLWVYDSGAWVKPASVFAARDGQWYLVDTLSIVCSGEYKTVLDQYAPTQQTALSLARGSTFNDDPRYAEHRAYWQFTIGGRMVGDIVNNGEIDLDDFVLLLFYADRFFDLLIPYPGARDWIEQQVIPYISDNPPPAP